MFSADARIKSIESKIKNGTLKLSDKTKEKISISKSIPVTCLTTGIKYKSALDAEKCTGLNRQLIAENCKGIRPFVKYPKKQKHNRPLNYKYDDTKYVFSYTEELSKNDQ